MTRSLPWPEGAMVPPARPLCHAVPGCVDRAIGWVKRSGYGQMWIPTCAKHVGLWTILGGYYSGQRLGGAR